MSFVLDPGYREYATDRQWELLETWAETGGQRSAAGKLGLARSSITDAWKEVRRKAGKHGFGPERDLVHKVAPGMASRGTSILYDAAGEVKEYWNKTRPEGRSPEEVVRLPDPKTIVKLSTLFDQDGKVTQQWVAEKPDAIAQAEAWQEYAKALTEDLPRIEPTPPPEITDDALMACYPVGDHHMGMLAWDEETGDNWDLGIGEKMLSGAINYLVAQAPTAERALIVFLGDFMHYDSFVPVTPTSRNQLDADSRFPKMVRATIRAMRYMIERTLMKHKTVHVIVEIGNHDLASSIFLMEALWNIYEKEKRVTVDTSPMHFHYYRFEACLIGVHHGHGVKMDKLPMIMASDRKEDWGETTHRMWWTGHLHTRKVQVAIGAQDFSGCTVEQFRVLPPQDAWASQKGYRSIRGMNCLVLHKKYGEVARNTVNPEMFYSY